MSYWRGFRSGTVPLNTSPKPRRASNSRARSNLPSAVGRDPSKSTLERAIERQSDGADFASHPSRLHPLRAAVSRPNPLLSTTLQRFIKLAVEWIMEIRLESVAMIGRKFSFPGTLHAIGAADRLQVFGSNSLLKLFVHDGFQNRGTGSLSRASQCIQLTVASKLNRGLIRSD
jgi:hypothetical protein